LVFASLPRLTSPTVSASHAFGCTTKRFGNSRAPSTPSPCSTAAEHPQERPLCDEPGALALLHRARARRGSAWGCAGPAAAAPTGHTEDRRKCHEYREATMAASQPAVAGDTGVPPRAVRSSREVPPARGWAHASLDHWARDASWSGWRDSWSSLPERLHEPVERQQ